MFTLPDLPYAPTALDPVISALTLETHHGKHHAGYVKALNTLLAERPGSTDPLETVITAAQAEHHDKLFNNAAQCWNHSFFWLSMCAERREPGMAFTQAIGTAFGDLAGLRAAMVAAGVGHFGSGWVWLTADAGGLLKVVATHDAHNPLAEAGETPLLVCDVWEHAYYLDHRNDRAAFLEEWFDHLADWSFAGRQYAAAISGTGAWQHPLPVQAAT